MAFALSTSERFPEPRFKTPGPGEYNPKCPVGGAKKGSTAFLSGGERFILERLSFANGAGLVEPKADENTAPSKTNRRTGNGPTSGKQRAYAWTTQRLHELQGQLDEAVGYIRGVSSEHEGLKSEMSRLQAENEELTEKLAHASQAAFDQAPFIESLEAEKMELTQSLESAVKIVFDKEMDLESVQQESAERAREWEALQAALQDTATEKDAALKLLQDHQDEQQKRVTTAQRRIATLQEQLDEVQEDSILAAQTVGLKNSELSMMSRKVVTLTSAVSSLEVQVSKNAHQHERVVEELRGKVEHGEIVVEEMQREMLGKDEARRDWQEAVGRQEELLSALESELEEAMITMRTAKATKEAEFRRRQQREAQLQESAIALEDAQAALQDAEVTIAELGTTHATEAVVARMVLSAIKNVELKTEVELTQARMQDEKAQALRLQGEKMWAQHDQDLCELRESMEEEMCHRLASTLEEADRSMHFLGTRLVDAAKLEQTAAVLSARTMCQAEMEVALDDVYRAAEASMHEVQGMLEAEKMEALSELAQEKNAEMMKMMQDLARDSMARQDAALSQAQYEKDEELQELEGRKNAELALLMSEAADSKSRALRQMRGHHDKELAAAICETEERLHEQHMAVLGEQKATMLQVMADSLATAEEAKQAEKAAVRGALEKSKAAEQATALSEMEQAKEAEKATALSEMAHAKEAEKAAALSEIAHAKEAEKAAALSEMQQAKEAEKATALSEMQQAKEAEKAAALSEVEQAKEAEKAAALSEVQHAKEAEKAAALSEMQQAKEAEKAAALSEMQQAKEAEKATALSEMEQAKEAEKATALSEMQQAKEAEEGHCFD
ncbi:hypothetical protein CYMTET_48931 [Cymbomonas tetramitiformis]|uniref:Uncharacterized protein n=1 Tax=Cymbomonas tetramitiformis TaxID=36881 RepID=A0AAE0EV18_9CHLO|nr:hypothetical protein CYMTET_48931 [Cymbomonas tetramitiformis]